jgi:hypothetical protein
MAGKKAVKKRFVLGGGLKLHDARQILGVPVIAHTGKVNAYARCIGTKIKAAHPESIVAAQQLMIKFADKCRGVPREVYHE